LARRRRLACLPPGCGRSPRSRYTRPRIGRSTAAVAAETVAAWSPRRIGWPVVVGGSVVVVVGSVVVVVVVVVVSCVVVGSTVVVGAVTSGWVVVAPNVVRAPVVVVRPAAVGVPLVAGWASGAVSGLVVDGAREVLGWRGRVVVVDADVGADPDGTVECAPPGGRVGVDGAGSRGTRAAEATRAARTEAVRPKAKSVSRQGCRGGSRCRGCRLGMASVVPVRLVLPLLGLPTKRAPYPPT
jgi:hypothetical protein